MRTTLKHTLAACIALGALALSGTACTDHDDPLGGNAPAGTQLLQLGEVTIAGAETATRADAPGFTGIRKTSFVAGDELVLTLNVPATGGGATPVEVTATLDGTTNRWTLPTKTYFTPGTTVSATHIPAAPTAPTGITVYGDDLVTAQPEPLKADGTPLALVLTHANALVEVTPPTGIDYENLTVSATPDGSLDAQVLATNEEGTSTDLRHRTIAPAGATLHSISLKVNGMVYTVDLTPEAVKVEANKRYPISLKMSAEEGLIASVAEDTDWGVGGDVNGYPTGYDYYIHTIEDLVKFRDDVNDGTAAIAVKALQTADIDMSGVAWSSIGSETNPFQGSYNGNGYSIKNLTMNKTYSSGETNYLGLFGYIAGAKITGVHLRNCTVTSSGGSQIEAGTLIGHTDMGSIVTLCSATGSVSVTGADYINAGGLVGYTHSNPTSVPNHFTRCSADVNVTINSVTRGNVGGFAGYTDGVYYAGCIASGKVHKICASINKGVSSGFSHTYSTNYVYHAIGCITNSEVVNDNGVATSAFGQITTLRGCLATGTYGNLYVAATDAVSNVHLNTMGDGTTANATPADAWGKLTASNVASPIKIKTLHYSAKDGYTLNVVEQIWFAEGIWKDNTGALPTIDMSYEGGAVPEPVNPGNNVYRVNGYWVTAPDADETANHSWTDAKSLCAAGAGKGWRLPTMKDFEAMLGWTGTHPWKEDATYKDFIDLPDAANFSKAFPIKNKDYWSSVELTLNTAFAWTFAINEVGTQGIYSYVDKTFVNPVRCVQKIAP